MGRSSSCYSFTNAQSCVLLVYHVVISAEKSFCSTIGAINRDMQYIGLAPLKILFNISDRNVGKMSYQCNATCWN